MRVEIFRFVNFGFLFFLLNYFFKDGKHHQCNTSMETLNKEKTNIENANK
jgi:hypothetical protein